MGDLHIVTDFFSAPEWQYRTLRVYVPDQYEAEPERRFPVAYMFDGQNLFAHPDSALYHTWCVNAALDRLVAEGRLEPWIVVGIDHTPGRLEEYTPWPYPRLNVRGRGQVTARVLVDHIKPFIERHLRVATGPENTAVLGASLGGLMALYLAREWPEEFGRIGAVSATVPWSDGAIFPFWDRPRHNWTRILLDVGADERIWYEGVYLDYSGGAASFHDHLLRLGQKPWEVRLSLEPGGDHHEISWQRRFPAIASYLLGSGR
ncbi:MAG: alpha/beta hydrolase [Planctomycetes bacterium]|nr:alpha/beta hydrolase [Planctomycetota bacterium]